MTYLGVLPGSVTDNDLNLQFLLMRVATTGFYIGPNVGVAIFTGSIDNSSLSVDSTTRFEAGAQTGYEVFLSDGFSVGPDVRWEHIFGSQTLQNQLKFTLQLAAHF